MRPASPAADDDTRGIGLFLCGAVMCGRGIDQILPHPGSPQLLEPYVHTALSYLDLAREVSGAIPTPVSFDYIWGDALAVMQDFRPAARIINLETAVTRSNEADLNRSTHYRMHPANLPCLTAAQIDCCVLANSHVLDWGRKGLLETLDSLHQAGIRTAGAGPGEAEAAQPAIIEVGFLRVHVHAFALPGAGVPGGWRAGWRRPGVRWLADLSARSVAQVGRQVARHPGGISIASIHWGPKWGYGVSSAEREFAYQLIDEAGVDLVHGHSSHHPRGIEVHDGKAILYGCGDLLNDYEGIGGHGTFRPELSLLYFPRLDAGNGRLHSLRMVPMRTRRLRLQHADAAETAWLAQRMDQECRQLGSRVRREPGGTLLLQW